MVPASLAAVCLVLAPHLVVGQSPAPLTDTGVVRGVVTSQAASITLAGALVRISNDRGAIVAQVLSGGDGGFEIHVAAPGLFRVRVTLDGFDPREASVRVTRGTTTEVAIDLPISAFSERVEVRQETTTLSLGTTLAPSAVLSRGVIDDVPLVESSVAGLLQLLPGVIRGPDGINIRGGRPTQSTQQMGPVNLTDVSLGGTLRVPVDAVASVEVLPNPYAVEYGRFSSGITVIESRRGGDRWQVSLKGFEPGFRLKRGTAASIRGIEWFAPRLALGGPLLPGRVWLATSAEYRYGSNEVRSRPESDRILLEDWSAASRLDARLSRNHTLWVSGLVSVEKRHGLGLDTFTPPEATSESHQHYISAIVSERASLATTMFLETSGRVLSYQNWSGRKHPGEMTIAPLSRTGTFFNFQQRRALSFQWSSALSGYHGGRHGEHLFKLGVDLLTSRLEATSESGPVRIRRLDGSLAESIEFGAARPAGVSAVDLALFIQDRWRPVSRLVIEAGLRVDRDGVIGRTSITPRGGLAIAIASDGSRLLRGGIGEFYERTPLLVGAFEALEPRTVTRYALDGVTRVAAPVVFTNRLETTLRTPHSLIWNVEYEHRLSPRLLVHADYLRRKGRDDLIAEPVVRGSTGLLLLGSRGRSRYWEVMAGARYARGEAFSVDASYVRATAENDYNAFSTFYSAVRDPIIRENAFGPANGDVHHRIVVRGNLALGDWSVGGVAEIRTGFPFSAVDERQDFVGLRNDAGRFPTVGVVNLLLQRRLHVAGWRPWIGLRADNLLNSWYPLDVQRNVDAPGFGHFYNRVPRRLRLAFRIER